MWYDLDYYVLHYHHLIGLFGHIAIITTAICSWYTFIRDDGQTGFELLIVTWILLCLSATCGFYQSWIALGMPVSRQAELSELFNVLVGVAGPILLTIPAAWKLFADGEGSPGRRRLLLAGAVTGLLDAVCLFGYLLWFWSH